MSKEDLEKQIKKQFEEWKSNPDEDNLAKLNSLFDLAFDEGFECLIKLKVTTEDVEDLLLFPERSGDTYFYVGPAIGCIPHSKFVSLEHKGIGFALFINPWGSKQISFARWSDGYFKYLTGIAADKVEYIKLRARA